MSKNIKYGLTSIIIILSLMLGYVVYAENNTTGKQPLKQMVQLMKDKRQEFKTEFEANREQTRLKIGEMRTNFKESLKNIKDANKRMSVERIVNNIQELNIKLTDSLNGKINQIENVLVSIKSRISKASDNGLDVSSLDINITKVEDAIKNAREAISLQAGKVYEVNITNETNLKAEMKKLRDTFVTDIKAVREKVKLAHQAAKDTATALAQIPNIDENKTSN